MFGYWNLHIYFLPAFFLFMLPISRAQECSLDFCAESECGPLNASFSSDGGPDFCEGETITLMNSSDQGFDYFVVDWNDGTIDTAFNYNDLFHTYDVADSLACGNDKIPFSICYVGIKNCANGISCQGGTIQFSLKLKPRAKWNFAEAPCVDNTLNFSDESCHTNESSTFFWDFGDGSSSADQNPTHSYSSPGQYIVSLTVTNECGLDTKIMTIEVFDYPLAMISLDASGPGGAGCAPFTQLISSISNGWVNTISWSIFPDSSNGNWTLTDTNMTLADTEIEVLFHNPGEYEVTLSYSNACETKDTTAIITVYDPIQYEISAPPAGCDVNMVCFDDMGLTFSGDAEGFQWTFVNGDIGSYFDSSNPDFGCVQFAENGEIILEILGPCTENGPQTVNVAVISTSEVSIMASLNDPICQNSDPVYLQPSTPGGTYYWNNTPVNFISNDTLYPESLIPQEYLITYIVGEGTPCPVDTTFSFEIEESITAMLTPAGPFCDTVNFIPEFSVSGEFNQITWQVSGDTMFIDQSTTPMFFLEEGVYSISVEVTGICGSATDTIDIIVQPDEQAMIDPVDDPYCSSQGQMNLTAYPPGGVWSGAGILNASTGLFSPNTAGPGPATINYTLSNGPCTSQDEITFQVIESELAVPSPVSLCKSDEVYQLLDFEPSGGSWSGPGILDALSGIIDLSLLEQDSVYSYAYCVDPSSVECEPCATTSIHINPLPEAGFMLDGQPCQGDVFTFMNTSTNAEEYLWNFGDGTTSFEQNPQHIFNDGGDYLVELIATSGEGCLDTISSLVHVVEPPVLDVLFTDQEGCAPLEVNYVNNSLGEGISQYWIIGSQDTLFDEQPVIILDSVLSDSVIRIELVVENGCRSFSQFADYLVHPYPIADFGINDDEGCSPDTVWFANATIGEPDYIAWNFGNGITFEGPNPPYQIYSSPDDSVSLYTISVYAENGCGSDSKQKQIQVYPNNVEPFFEIDTTRGCPPLPVKLNSYTTAGATITYDFGNGETGSSGDTVYTYLNPGKFVITQYAQLCGIDSVKSDTISVFPVPQVRFSHDPSVCEGLPVHFENNSNTNLQAEWDFGDGTSSNEFEPVHLYSEPGTYKIRLTLYSEFYNCPAVDSSSILIREKPSATFSPGSANACPGEEISLSVSDTGGVFYAWYFGDGSGDTTKNPVHIYPEPGTYEISLIVFDEFGCSSDTIIHPIVIFDQPESIFEISGPELCFGIDDLSTTNSSEGYTASLWYLNGMLINSQEEEITIENPAPGDYEITLVSVNAFGCTDSMTRTFQVFPQPHAEFLLEDQNLCAGDTSIIFDLSTDATEYQWFLDENLVEITNSSFTTDSSGQFQLSLIISHENVCYDTFFHPVLISVFESPEADFDFLINNDPNILGDVEFMNLSKRADIYFWDFGDGHTSDEINPVHEYDMNGPAQVSLTATALHDQITCSDIDIKLIEFERLNRFYAPNAMSPDKNFGNELVSVFKPVGVGLASYELMIYSPWGDVIAILDEVTNEAPSDFWDGTYKGEIVPQGVYPWKARIEYTDGDIEFQSGNITVIR